jgi:hypothetical protein
VKRYESSGGEAELLEHVTSSCVFDGDSAGGGPVANVFARDDID